MSTLKWSEELDKISLATELAAVLHPGMAHILKKSGPEVKVILAGFLIWLFQQLTDLEVGHPAVDRSHILGLAS